MVRFEVEREFSKASGGGSKGDSNPLARCASRSFLGTKNTSGYSVSEDMMESLSQV